MRLPHVGPAGAERPAVPATGGTPRAPTPPTADLDGASRSGWAPRRRPGSSHRPTRCRRAPRGARASSNAAMPIPEALWAGLAAPTELETT